MFTARVDLARVDLSTRAVNIQTDWRPAAAGTHGAVAGCIPPPSPRPPSRPLPVQAPGAQRVVSREGRLHALAGHRDGVTGLALGEGGAGGALLYSAAFDHSIRVWDAKASARAGTRRRARARARPPAACRARAPVHARTGARAPVSSFHSRNLPDLLGACAVCIRKPPRHVIARLLCRPTTP